MIEKPNVTENERWYYGKAVHRRNQYWDMINLKQRLNEPLIKKLGSIIREDKMCLWYITELVNMYYIAKNQLSVPGISVEVGTFTGTSAKVILAAGQTLYTYDTFEGFVDVSEHDNKTFENKTFAITEDTARHRLKEFPNCHIIKGVFPDKTDVIKDKRFNLVHIDCDMYESVKNAIKFCLPRLSDAGIILFHDYPESHGLVKAVKEEGLDILQIGSNQGIYFHTR